MAYQDFTTFIETDPNSHISLATNVATFTGIARTETAYATKDFGAGYFTDFVHRFKITVTNNDGNGIVGVWTIYNTIYSNGFYVALYMADVDAVQNVRIDLGEVGGSSDVYQSSVETGTWYIEVSRTGTTATAKIYSDSSYSTLVDTLTLSVASTAYRYHACVGSNPVGGSGTITGTSENLEFLFPTRGILDRFTTNISPNWLIWDGEFNVDSNTLAPRASDGFGYGVWGNGDNPTLFTDMEAYVTIVTKSAGNNSPQIRVRYTTDETDSFYEVQVNPSASTVVLVRYDLASPTIIGTASQVVSNGDKVGVSAIGSALKVYWYTSGSWNQTPIISVSDSTYASGWTVLLLQGSTTQRMDDFGGTPTFVDSHLTGVRYMES